MTLRQQFLLMVLLSVPSVISQFSSMVMEYIDAAMVGRLGANASASIGIIFTSVWLFWGICTTVASGFSVQVAHHLGAGNKSKAREVLRHSLVATLLFSMVLVVLGVVMAPFLPYWLGADERIAQDASRYFLIFILSLPALQLNFLASSMLQSSGNMHTPSILNVLMCVLDIIFNYFLIYTSHEVHLWGITMIIPGAGLGVTGAALGTALAQIVTASLLLWYLFKRDPNLKLINDSHGFRPSMETLRKAIKISLPMTIEHILICGAHIIITIIVAPLGIAAIAANSFAITAESICYLPGYGIAEAATTLIGQSFGADRKMLARRFANIAVYFGIGVMAVMGLIMYISAPLIMGIMTPDKEIWQLGVMALHIEAFAEPLFAAAIVGYGVFVGAGDTLIPSLMNLFSIWVVRLLLAARMASVMGFRGVWLAMCLELCFRGTIFLIRLHKGKWANTRTHSEAANPEAPLEAERIAEMGVV